MNALADLTDGQIVHVARTRVGRRWHYTRCRVESGSDGQAVFRALAMVGDWPSYLRPRRTELGTISLGNGLAAKVMPAEEVLRGLTLGPVTSDRVCEISDPALARTLAREEPLDLTVAPMSAAERAAAWDRWLISHLTAEVLAGADASTLLDRAAQLTAARTRPFPAGEPTLDHPSHPPLWN